MYIQSSEIIENKEQKCNNVSRITSLLIQDTQFQEEEPINFEEIIMKFIESYLFAQKTEMQKYFDIICEKHYCFSENQQRVLENFLMMTRYPDMHSKLFKYIMGTPKL